MFIIIIDHFCVSLFSTLEQVYCARVAPDSQRMTVAFFYSTFFFFFNIHQVVYWQRYLVVAWLAPRKTAGVSQRKCAHVLNLSIGDKNKHSLHTVITGNDKTEQYMYWRRISKQQLRFLCSAILGTTIYKTVVRLRLTANEQISWECCNMQIMVGWCFQWEIGVGIL